MMTATQNCRSALDALLAGHTPQLAAQRIVPLHPNHPEAGRRWVELLYRPPESLGKTASPEQVVRLAERSGYAARLDYAVIRAGVEWALHQPPGVLVALNVSAETLNTPGFADFVLTTVQEAGVTPSQILLELSERHALFDAPHLQDNLQRLNACGIQFALDDFGVACGNLQVLTQLSPAAIKLDRLVVQAAIAPDRTERGRALLVAIAAFASTLGIDLVLEGVETEDEIERLRAIPTLRHAYLQGYAIERPQLLRIL